MTTSAPLESLLAQWLPGRRWYPAKGRAVTVRVVADLPLPSPGKSEGGTDDGDGPGLDPVRVRVLVVDLHPDTAADGSAAGTTEDPVHVQVPVVERRALLGSVPGDALIGTLARPDGPVHLYDGTHDPAYVAALSDALTTPATSRSTSGWIESVPGPSSPPPPAPGSPSPTGRVLSGEQSNTSVIVEIPGAPLIVKIFRTLQAGENPDVVLQTALARAGSTRVPPPAGHLRAGWIGHDGEEVVADVAFASGFLPGSPDAWRTATAALAEGASFDAEARDLGAATAEVHRALATTLPTHPATPVMLARLADSLAARVRWAVMAAPELGPDVSETALSMMQRVRLVVRAPDWQRIHGDLHLGQVLRPPGRGWVLLDFEGEPLRPLAERVEPDSPLRDVAGMLRSFDYAAGRAAAGTGEAAVAARAWAASARGAFCDGYASVAGRDPREDAILLRALELEKALYEVVYETRNRPDWVGVPLTAVRRLLSR